MEEEIGNQPQEEGTEGTQDIAAQVLEYQNLYLRARADLDNYQRRAEREVERAVRMGKKGLFLRLLEVLDNLERALGTGEAQGESLLAGVKMVHRQFWGVLEAEGVKAITVLGEAFDPARHEVLQVEESFDPTQEKDLVSGEFQKGYTWGEEILRPARVKVVKAQG